MPIGKSDIVSVSGIIGAANIIFRKANIIKKDHICPVDKCGLFCCERATKSSITRGKKD